jgi:hypothetical protein
MFVHIELISCPSNSICFFSRSRLTNNYERLFKDIILAVLITDFVLIICSECKEKIAKKDFDK